MNETSDKLKKTLVEWHEFTLPPLAPRHRMLERFGTERLLAIIGARRTGKTFACFEFIRDLLEQGVPRTNILYVNFEDERLLPLTGQELTRLLEVQSELFESNPAKPLYCFIDEVHQVPHWSKWVRRITDTRPDLHVILTGSSSKMLSVEIATELRGRARVLSVFPYSFAEYLKVRSPSTLFSTRLPFSPQAGGIKRIFNDYLNRGGFPGVANLPDPRETLQQYYHAMFGRDMIERFNIRNVRQFEDFLKIQVTRFSSLSSLYNTEKEMKSLGYRLSQNTLAAYFGYARDAFLLSDLCKYDPKITRQLRAPRKLYAVDHGLLNAVRFSSSEDRGRLLENIAFHEFRRRHDSLFYYSDKYECDFVVMEGRSVCQCCQVCWSIENPETAEREIRGLAAALQAFKLGSGIILTHDGFADLERDGKKIKVRPLWYYSLYRATHPDFKKLAEI